jgi:L-iditol 2-dehydrogenase
MTAMHARIAFIVNAACYDRVFMRIAELVEYRTFRLREGEIPGPAAGQVQVRVEAVGICGSDLHSYSEGGVGGTPAEYPMVLGHEPAGVVVKTGAGVGGWQPGDRVFCEPAIYCYHCEFCHAGRHNVCANIRFMSMPGDPGYFRDFVTVPERNLLAVPPNLGLPYATLIEPLAVALHSMKFVALAPGETAAVFGAGPIGFLTAACLKLAGAGRVWSIDPVASRRELVRVTGVDCAIDPAVDPVAEILRDTGGRGVDVAIDCATTDGTINQCINAVRNGGRVVVTGIPAEAVVQIEFSPMRRKEIAFFNVRRSNHESEQALALLARYERIFAPLVTHQRPLERIGEAFDQLEHYRDGAGKIVMTP